LVWGLYLRGLGLVLFISFLSLSFQAVPNAGKRAGAGSIARRMAKIREDFGPMRLLYFPTLLWLSPSDMMLRLLTWVGLASSALVIYGGPWSHYAIISCYVCYLSLDMPMGLVFPWDCLLLESTFLAMFLPPTAALPSFDAAAVPTPLITWVFRLLFFRVMFGFGKQKFLGSRRKDSAYLRGFLIYQPLLTPIAWYMHKLPLWILKGGVMFMFFCEIPAPFFSFFPGPLSILTAVASSMLVLGIQATGNFGYFSFLTVVAAIPLLDNLTPHALVLSRLFAEGQPLFTHAVLLVHTLSVLVVFPWNSWFGAGWTLWALWYRLPRWCQPIVEFYRFTQPFRWLHPYGVFPPNNQPGVKMALLPEVSWDEQHWHELHFRFAPNHERSLPHFVAPHHPRGDQAIIYDTFGLNANSLMGGLLGPWDPYYYATVAPAVEFCQKLVQSNVNTLAQGEALAQHTSPPLAARITTVMLEPVSLEERRRTGRLWKRTYVGPHVPTHHFDPEFAVDAYGEPELWHPESVMWRRRSRFHELMERSRARRDDPMQLAIWDGRLTAADVEMFWNDYLPIVTAADRTTFDTLPAVVDAVSARFDRKQRRVLARLQGRFTLILMARLEPLWFYGGMKPKLPAPSYLHLWMMAQQILAQGKDAYLRALDDESIWHAELGRLTAQTGLYLLSVFRFGEMCFEAQKLRLLNCVTFPHDPTEKRRVEQKQRRRDDPTATKGERLVVKVASTLSAFFWVMFDIRDGFDGPAFNQGFPELYPTFEELESGDIRLTSYAYLKPGTPAVPDLKSVPMAE
jgi:hypothetical protein